MTAQTEGGAMTAAYVRVHCGTCGKEVFAIPDRMTLVLDNGGARYTFHCPTCGPRDQEAHNWFAMQLLAAGVPIRDAADVMATDLEDDDAIDAELGWDNK